MRSEMASNSRWHVQPLIAFQIFILIVKAQQKPSQQLSLTPGEFSFTSCSPKDFTPSCTLSCLVGNANDDLQAISYAFQYYTTDPAVELPLSNYELSYIANTLFPYAYFNLSLQLDDYNAGVYQCSLRIKNTSNGTITNYDHQFQIDPDASRSWIGSNCIIPQDCLTLNATCDNTCQCANHNYINFNGQACLSAVMPGDNCLIDEQCEGFQPGTHCVGQQCIYGQGITTQSHTTVTTIIPDNRGFDQMSTTDIINFFGVSFGSLAFLIIIIILIVVAVRLGKVGYSQKQMLQTNNRLIETNNMLTQMNNNRFTISTDA